MKNFTNYSSFIFDLKMHISMKANPYANYIIEFSCLDPILKDNRLSYKRVTYTEVCCIDSDNHLIWFDDWYEGYQKSFDIISIITVNEIIKLQNDYEDWLY